MDADLGPHEGAARGSGLDGERAAEEAGHAPHGGDAAALVGARRADPVVGHLHPDRAVPGPHHHREGGGVGVAAHVVDRLLEDPHDDRLGRPVELEVVVDRHVEVGSPTVGPEVLDVGPDGGGQALCGLVQRGERLHRQRHAAQSVGAPAEVAAEALGGVGRRRRGAVAGGALEGAADRGHRGVERHGLAVQVGGHPVALGVDVGHDLGEQLAPLDRGLLDLRVEAGGLAGGEEVADPRQQQQGAGGGRCGGHHPALVAAQPREDADDRHRRHDAHDDDRPAAHLAGGGEALEPDRRAARGVEEEQQDHAEHRGVEGHERTAGCGEALHGVVGAGRGRGHTGDPQGDAHVRADPVVGPDAAADRQGDEQPVERADEPDRRRDRGPRVG